MPAPAPATAPPRARRWLRAGLPLAAVLLTGAVLAGVGLGNDLFWDDEANTAIFARNLLATGALSGWDGTNLIGYRGGAELDENLINVYMPPAQYYVAALGFALLGEGTITARVPFVVAGLLALLALALLSRRWLGDAVPPWLPAALAAVAPAYLLYIRNCRYYSVGALLFVALLAAFGDPLRGRQRAAVAYVVALLAAAGLILTNYFNALGAFLSLGVMLLFARFRTRRHLALVGLLGIVGGLLAWWVWETMNPFGSAVARPDETAGLERFVTLAGWHLAGLGTFEFFPVCVTPALALPFVLRRLAALRPLAWNGLAAAAAMLVVVLATAAFSPQSVSGSVVADMRYLVPLIPFGALVTAAALVVLWHLARPAALLVAALVVCTNLAHLGFLGEHNGYLEPRGVQCTLCSYVQELGTDRTTSNEAVIDYVRALPERDVLLILPGYMAYAAMYYLPERRFCCQLEADRPLRDDLRATLPPYVFWDRAEPDVALINRPPPASPTGPLTIFGHDLGTYRYRGLLNVASKDFSRPEIPWHAFDPADVARMPHPGFVVVDLSHPRR